MWELADGQLSLSLDRFDARMDATSPTGLQIIRVGAQRLEMASQLYALQSASGKPAQSDAYVRGNDAVILFPYDSVTQLQASMRWSFVQFEELQAVELVFSIETSVLDADSRCVLRSTFPGASYDADKSSDGIQVLSQAGGDHFALITQPSDYTESRVNQSESDVEILESLFGFTLEKGVIRRARLAWVPFNSSELDTVLRYQKRIADSLPPLTT